MSLDDRDYMRSGPPPFGEWVRKMGAFQAVFILTVAVFFVQWVLELGWVRDALSGEQVRPMGGTSLEILKQGYWGTLFMHPLVHGGWGSFLGNMLLFWLAGRGFYLLAGSRQFVAVYALAALAGAALEMCVGAVWLGNSSELLMGASASVMGLLGACAVAMGQAELPLLNVRFASFFRLLLGVNAVLALGTVFGAFPGWLPLEDMAYLSHVGGGVAGYFLARSFGYGRVRPLARMVPPVPMAGSRLRRRPQMVRASQPRHPEVEVDMDAVLRENPGRDPLLDLMRDEVDPILDKINDYGMGSLTDDERRALQRASRRFTRKDSPRSGGATEDE